MANDGNDRYRQIEREARMRETRLQLLLSALGIVPLTIGLILIEVLFNPYVPQQTLWFWTIGMATVYAGIIANSISYFVLKPSDERIERVWWRIGKALTYTYGAWIALSVWLLLPYAPESLRFLIILLYGMALAGQIVIAADAIDEVGFSIVAIFGSVAAFLIADGGSHAWPVSTLVALLGILMFGASLTVRRATRSAMAARVAAENLAEQLKDALAQAQNERDAKTRFLASASHDLRQPIHAAGLFLASATHGADDSARVEATAGARRALLAAEKLLDSILEYLRLDAGTINPTLRPVAAAQLLEAIGAEALLSARAAGYAVSVEPTPLWVRADPNLAERAMRNFADNAIRHSGGRRLMLSAARVGSVVRLAVSDDGHGVDAEEAPYLFREYIQGMRAGRDPKGGLGIGLASAKRMAQLMCGKAGWAPHQGGGATFFIDLPEAEPILADHQMTLDAASPASRLKVLLIEDDADSRTAMAGLLRDWGWRVYTAEDCAATKKIAQTAAADGGIDLIVADWRLPEGRTGAEAITAARGALGETTPALLLSGDGSAESHRAIVATGVPVAFKPVDPNRFRDLAQAIVQTTPIRADHPFG